MESQIQRNIYNRNYMTTLLIKRYNRSFFKKFAWLKDSCILKESSLYGVIKLDFFPGVYYNNKSKKAPYVTHYGAKFEVGLNPFKYRNRVRLNKIFPGWVLFLNCYYGQDQYNLNFRQKILQINVGLKSEAFFDLKIID